jgi:hypothetical protein
MNSGRKSAIEIHCNSLRSNAQLAVILMGVLSVPLFLMGVIFLCGKEKWLYAKNELPVRRLTQTERLAVGLSCCLFGGFMIATLYGTIVLDYPYWLLDKVFGLVR